MTLTCAIGDVHGRLDLLRPLLDAIEAETRGEIPRIVFLGDIIDRGPQSRACLDLVIETLAARPGSRLILGNHEELLLRFLGGAADREAAAPTWLANGGTATLASYGFGSGERIDAIARRFRTDFAGHAAALAAADWMVEAEHHVFVHGGIDPLVPLAGQDPETTRWIRREFLDWRGPLPKTVVHGHTPTESALPEIHPNRIALDTGAWFSGHLTCALFADDGAPRFLATDDSAGAVSVARVRPLDFR